MVQHNDVTSCLHHGTCILCACILLPEHSRRAPGPPARTPFCQVGTTNTCSLNCCCMRDLRKWMNSPTIWAVPWVYKLLVPGGGVCLFPLVINILPISFWGSQDSGNIYIFLGFTTCLAMGKEQCKKMTQDVDTCFRCIGSSRAFYSLMWIILRSPPS